MSASDYFKQTITYAAVSSRDGYGKPALGSSLTSLARIQPTRVFVRDQAGDSIQAAYCVYVLPSLSLTYQHRIWLPGDNLSDPLKARRILAIEKPVDGVGTSRFHKVWL